MMKNKLYVIGNGFDIYHGLDTKYCTFGLFLKDKHVTIYDHLIEYYGFPDLDINGGSIYDGALWAEFENSLALLDSDTVLEAYSDSVANPSSPGFRDRDWNTFTIDIEMIVEELTVKLFKAFREFILKVEYPNHLDVKNLPLDKNALYLTFNYTDTVERYYGVPRENILHIHGKASSKDNVLILGHGIDPQNFELEDPKPPEGLNDEEHDQWLEHMADSYDHSYELGKNELLNYFSQSFKETNSIINDNQSFFETVQNIKEVIILGHSLSEIDMPYIIKIFNSITKDAKWVATYYSEDEKLTHEETLKGLSIVENDIELILMSELI